MHLALGLVDYKEIYVKRTFFILALLALVMTAGAIGAARDRSQSDLLSDIFAPASAVSRQVTKTIDGKTHSASIYTARNGDTCFQVKFASGASTTSCPPRKAIFQDGPIYAQPGGFADASGKASLTFVFGQVRGDKVRQVRVVDSNCVVRPVALGSDGVFFDVAPQSLARAGGGPAKIVGLDASGEVVAERAVSARGYFDEGTGC